MEGFTKFAISTLFFAIWTLSAYGQQVGTPCTTSMITSFSPCLSSIVQSSGNNGSSATPNSDCCNSLKSLTGSSMNCACLIITGSVPFQIPINRTLAISLPRACNMGGVPVQCKGAPGPASFGPVSSPSAISPAKDSSSPDAITPSMAPEPQTTIETPPTGNTEIPKAPLTPSSAAELSNISLPSALFISMVMLLKYYG